MSRQEETESQREMKDQCHPEDKCLDKKRQTQREMKHQCHPGDKCLDKKRQKLRDRLSVELFFEDHLEKQAKE